MKVVQFIASRGYGGAEKVFIDLCNELITSSELSLEVILLENNEISKYLNNEIVVHTIKDHSRYNPLLYIKLLPYVKDKIVHTHSAKATKIIYNLSFFVNFKHIGTKHNVRKGSIFNKIKNVIAVSPKVAKTIKIKSKIFYNGINPLEKYKINEVKAYNTFTIIAIGRLDRVKRFDKLIQDLSNLEKDYRLLIVGEGEEKNNLEKIILELNLNNKVFLKGFHENIPELMNNSNMVIITSSHEGFSLVAIESLFYSNLLISTKVGICEEILSDTFLINDNKFASKIKDVLENYEEYVLKFGEVKKRYQKQFLLSLIVKDYINYLKDFIYNDKKGVDE